MERNAESMGYNSKGVVCCGPIIVCIKEAKNERGKRKVTNNGSSVRSLRYRYMLHIHRKKYLF